MKSFNLMALLMQHGMWHNHLLTPSNNQLKGCNLFFKILYELLKDLTWQKMKGYQLVLFAKQQLFKYGQLRKLFWS